MERRHIFMAVAMVSLVNGLFSPFGAVVFGLMPVWMPSFVPVSLPLALAVTAMITAFGTLLISGIPAAVYERLTGAPTSTETSLWLWLGSAVLLTLPALPVIAGLM